MKKLLASIVIFSCGLISAHAQLGDLENLIKGSREDANYLMEGYVSPVLNSIGYGLNQGWFNTAKPHKTLGIDVTVTVSMVTIPKSAETYTVDNSKLTALQLTNNPTNQVPTIVGPSTNPPTYSFKPPLNSLSPVQGPAGLQFINDLPIKAVPVPIFNVGVGLIKGTEVKVRYVPTLTNSDGSGSNFNFGLKGIGVMHDIKQWIPVVKHMPFDLSVFAGITKLDADFDINSNGQKGIFSANATTVQAIISKKLAILTLYGSVGYNKSTVNFDAKGDFDLGTTTLTDPVSLSATANGPRATAGLRLRLGPLNFNGDYTLQKYPTISLGVGVGFRNP